MMLEKDLKKKILRLRGDDIFIQSIESGGTGLGIPDLYIRTRNNSIWMELKRLIWKKSYKNGAVIPISFEPGQFNWLKVNRELGGFVVLSCIIIGGPHDKQVFFYKNYNIFKQYNLFTIVDLADLKLNYRHFDSTMILDFLNRR